MTVMCHAVADFFVLRTPSHPFALLESRPMAGTGGDDPATRPDEDLAAKVAWLRARLKEAVARPEVREALYLASPEFEGRLTAWLGGRLSGERMRRIEQSLIRYLTRMSSRPTPFGLFAGCAVGTWGASTRMVVPPLKAARRRTRLDMDYVGALVAALERTPEVQATQTFRPNNSLHLAAGRWHCAEGRVGAGAGRDYHLIALEPTSHLDGTMRRAASGETFANLARGLAQTEAVGMEEAAAFLADLLDAQVLTSALQPPLTGTEPFPALVAQLKGRPETQAMGVALADLQDGLTRFDADGLGHPVERYQAMADALAPFKVPIDPKRLFQVDLFKPTPDLALGPNVRKAMEEAVELLRRLTPPRQASELDRFKAAFRQRYDTRPVALLEALDPEAGLGFGFGLSPGLEGSPLLEGLAFPSRKPQQERAFTERDGYLMQKLLSLRGAQEWALDERDLAALANPEAVPFPDSFAAMAAVAAGSVRALEQGDFKIFMAGFHGPSGARLLGRFCHGDPELEDQVRAYLEAEEALRPGVVFAEIVHQPDGRMGNILARPSLRRHEIPYLGVSGVPHDQQIQPDDLWLTLVGDRLVLRSRRLACEVLPRLTSAHNVALGLPVYRFLAALQDQDGGPGGWTWGALANLPFLPRVTRGRHVLARARWHVEARTCPAVFKAREGEAFAAFQALREATGLPRYVVLEDHDNTLLVDLDQPLRVATLQHLIAQRPAFTLGEWFPGPEELVAEGPEGKYCHELVVPFQAQAAWDGPEPERINPNQGEAIRTFLPGSEWLYLKLYTGEASADRVLIETIGPLLEAHRGAWDRWFFIRYADPAPHLRLRFHGVPDVLTGVLLPALHQALGPLLKAGVCWKVQIDTYERELERYGGAAGIPWVEAWFDWDSRRVLALLGACQGDEGARQRWRHALPAIDGLLDGLGFDLPAKLGLMEATRKAMSREFQAQGLLDIQLGDRFRSLRQELEGMVSASGDRMRGGVPGEEGGEPEAILSRLGQASALGELTTSREALASSLVHMHVNRLLRSSQRAHEFVLVEFLARIYRSRICR